MPFTSIKVELGSLKRTRRKPSTAKHGLRLKFMGHDMRDFAGEQYATSAWYEFREILPIDNTSKKSNLRPPKSYFIPMVSGNVFRNFSAAGVSAIARALPQVWQVTNPFRSRSSTSACTG